MTSTQRHLDGFLTALDLDRGAAAELRHLTNADTQRSQVPDSTDLAEDFDVRWMQVEHRRARDDAARPRRRRLILTALSVCAVTGAIAVGVFLHSTDRIAAPIHPPITTDLNSSRQGPATHASRQTVTSTIADGGVLITGITPR
ncbi:MULTISPECIES: hypothetical protein [Nocardia]|uniref:hypothetical protein n=1 Tax=Nocardia TaxID=1817 RepID=UPI0007EB608A|nr:MULTISPECIES: hypothetical protein [Nocardia]MBF6278644.1 hypothetical protein [Nocardia nova]OBA56503.1 hypothetical protein A5789_00035 [Nocardia sp. 852002-51101_SCH5132738]OBB46875.1 hypothetical protein A5748_24205 [Nocardia sp. 852002-51244_SCH5132740]OBF86060.1 hypothetical protein A9X06_13040 [Mycobacterium sp. 852002-51759_SCH5129042]